jgi:diguanylate cyclase (GGDEF)-like protein
LPDNVPVTLDLAADLMGLAQRGEVAEACRLAERTAPETAGEDPADQAAFWYAVSVARHIQGDNLRAFEACDRCVGLAVEAGSAGWASNGLSMRAMASARQGQLEGALVDLARAERELLSCDDPGLASWAHTGLGYAYLELRLYELALPHMEAALRLDARPIPLVQAPVIDVMNLGELHLRWADELERVFTDGRADEEVAQHRVAGHALAERALGLALERGDPSFVESCRALELSSRSATTTGPVPLEELRTAYDAGAHSAYSGGRTAAGGALARELWDHGRHAEALDVARGAADDSAAASDWHVTASAHRLVVELEARAGLPGAEAGRSYAALLSRVLWDQRLSTLQGAQAALELEQLHVDAAVARRAAHEDALTGLGNRRAFDEAMRALPDPPAVLPAGHDDTVSLVVVDVDDFKPVNDTHGHLVGDEVLRAVAAAIDGVSRAGDLVARIGGDEFAVLVHGDPTRGHALAERIEAAVAEVCVAAPDGLVRPSVSIGVSTGVATLTGSERARRLLGDADAAMYRSKAGRAARLTA